jgi:hypothetical protein
MRSSLSLSLSHSLSLSLSLFHSLTVSLSLSLSLSLSQAVVDMTVIMNEILTDASIFTGQAQDGLLSRINRSPVIYPKLDALWGINSTLLETIRSGIRVRVRVGGWVRVREGCHFNPVRD